MCISECFYGCVDRDHEGHSGDHQQDVLNCNTTIDNITSRVNLVDLLTSDPVLVEEEAAQSEQAVAAWQKQHDMECFSCYDNISGADNGLGVWNTSNGNSSSTPSKEPLPMMKFEHGRFLEVIMKAIRREGFESPMPIQSATWPMVLSDKNVIGIARTGSGKTLTFLLLTIHREHPSAAAHPVRRRPRRTRSASCAAVSRLSSPTFSKAA